MMRLAGIDIEDDTLLAPTPFPQGSLTQSKEQCRSLYSVSRIGYQQIEPCLQPVEPVP